MACTEGVLMWMKREQGRDGAKYGASDTAQIPGKRTLTEAMPAMPVMRKMATDACATCGGAADEGAPCPKCDAKQPADAAAAGGGADAPLVPAGGGRGFAPDERAPFERAFGADFGDVRVHEGSAAGAAAESIQAKAFTSGSDVVFGAGQFAPGTPDGKRLIAHELAHVQQQKGQAPAIAAYGSMSLSTPGDAAEHEADHTAEKFMAGEQVATPSAKPTGIARSPLPSAPTDWEIHRPGARGSLPAGAPQRIFFDRNASAVAPGDPAIAASALPAAADLELIGYASADEITADPTIVQRRVDNVKAALVARGHQAAHITTTLRPSPKRPDYRRVRSVEIVGPSESSVESVPGAPATQPCDAATEAAFQAAKTHAINHFIDPVVALLGAPVAAGSTLERALARFFHGPANAATVRTNLGKIKTEIGVLAGAANHRCATMNDSSCAGGAIAYNDPGARRMTICPGYVPIGGSIPGPLKDEHARNLIHEAAHSTGGLSGVPATSSGGTTDFGYRHQRMIDHLPLAKELANSDSYAMFVLTVMGGSISAAPPVDTAGAGFSMPGDQAQFDRAEVPLARIENWIRRAQQWMLQTHGVAREILDAPAGPTRSWTSRFSAGATMAQQSGFDVRLPPALPASDDDVKYAAISDRLTQLARMLQSPVEISRDTSPGARMHWVLGTPLQLVVNPTFLANGPDVRANMMLERLIDIMPVGEVSASLRPAYPELVRRVRLDENL
jgi:hypothetical protein